MLCFVPRPDTGIFATFQSGSRTMLKTFRYRLVPNKTQRDKLQRTLDSCRFLYNCALEQRRSQRIGIYEQKRQLTEVRHSFNEYKDIHVHVLQNTLFKLDRAFQAFFRRCRNGEKPGFPRFKNENRFDSFAFNNTGFKLQGKILPICKIGNVKVRLSRPLPKDSTIKALTVKRVCGAWYACLAVEYTPTPLPASDKAVGIDLGLESFAALSNGERIGNPRFLEKNARELRRAQRRVARRQKGSHRRRKAVLRLQKVHERIRNRRLDWLHKRSTELIRKYGLIVAEELHIRGLAQGVLAKQVLDAGWATFLRMVSYKAAEAGRRFEKVEPKYTSQTCPACGAVKKKKLSERMHRCDCGYQIHRDIAAAQVILGRICPLGANVAEVVACVA